MSKIDIYIYILCYNEEILIENTIKHYKNNFPNSIIIILDNYSTDNSINIAKKYNCNIEKWKSDVIDEHKYLELKNNIWKKHKKGWVIICDMDELLELTYNDLVNEDKNNVSIINTLGINIVSESINKDLSDLNLNKLNKGFIDENYSKKICFNIEKIKSINYTPGCHICNPEGDIIFSKKRYIMKHLNFLGEKYYITKILNRYSRKTEYSKKMGYGTQYIDKVEEIKKTINLQLKKKIIDINKL